MADGWCHCCQSWLNLILTDQRLTFNFFDIDRWHLTVEFIDPLFKRKCLKLLILTVYWSEPNVISVKLIRTENLKKKKLFCDKEYYLFLISAAFRMRQMRKTIFRSSSLREKRFGLLRNPLSSTFRQSLFRLQSSHRWRW